MSTGERASERAEDLRDKTTESIGKVKDKAAEGVGKARKTAEDIGRPKGPEGYCNLIP